SACISRTTRAATLFAWKPQPRSRGKRFWSSKRPLQRGRWVQLRKQSKIHDSIHCSLDHEVAMLLLRLITVTTLSIVPPTLLLQDTPETTPLAARSNPALLVIQPESRLWFEGTSTVRDFRCEATRIDGAVELDAAGLS